MPCQFSRPPISEAGKEWSDIQHLHQRYGSLHKKTSCRSTKPATSRRYLILNTNTLPHFLLRLGVCDGAQKLVILTCPDRSRSLAKSFALWPRNLESHGEPMFVVPHIIPFKGKWLNWLLVGRGSIQVIPHLLTIDPNFLGHPNTLRILLTQVERSTTNSWRGNVPNGKDMTSGGNVRRKKHTDWRSHLCIRVITANHFNTHLCQLADV